MPHPLRRWSAAEARAELGLDRGAHGRDADPPHQLSGEGAGQEARASASPMPRERR